MRRVCVVLLLLAPTAALAAEEAKVPPAVALDVGGHTAPVRAVFFRNGGKELVSVADDRTARVWDVASGETLRVLRLPPASADPARGDLGVRAALSPDGATLAVSARSPTSNDSWIYLLDLAGRGEARVLKGHGHPVLALAWSPDGRRLASAGSVAAELFLWDVATGARQHRLTGHQGFVRALAFAPDGARLASGGADHTVRLWSVATGQLDKELKDPPGNVLALAWGKDGTLAARVFAHHLLLWDADGKLRRQHTARYDGTGLAFSPANDRDLLVGSCVVNLKMNGRIRTRFSEGVPDEEEDAEHSLRVAHAVALSPEGVAAWGGEADLFLWNARGRGPVKEPVKRLGGRGHVLQEVACGTDGKRVAWAYLKNEAPRWAFDLAALKLGRVTDQALLRAEHQRGGLTLEVGPAEVRLKSGDETKQVLKLVGLDADRCRTFFGDGHVLVGGESGAFLFDLPSGTRVQGYRGGGGMRALVPGPGERYFVSGGLDQTLHVWLPKRERPLLSLFVSGREPGADAAAAGPAPGSDWVAWTPEGYYAASPGGEKLMGWLVTGRPEQPADFYPAAQLRKTYYRPDVIARLLEAGSVEKALALADAARQPKPAADPEEVLPPSVKLLTPAPGPVTGPAVEVTAVAQSRGKHPVTALRLFVDDRPFEGLRGVRQARGTDLGERRSTWTVPLAPGPHKLAVVAESGGSQSLPAVVEVECVPPAGTSSPAARPGLGNLYVLAIGIDAYPGEWKLSCCKNDAEELAATFAATNREPELFARVETKTVLDTAATRSGILEGLDWLKAKAKARDVAVLFYGGHGETDDKGQFYLLSAEWAPDRPQGTTVTGDELKERLADLPCRVVLLLDACHAGAAARKRVPMKLNNLASDLTGEVGAVVLFAAGSGELAGEANGHGFFTQALLDGLRGSADRSPKDGIVHLNELLTYVEYRGAELSKDEQHPTYDKPGNVHSFPLAKP